MLYKVPNVNDFIINESINQKEIQTKDGVGVSISDAILEDEFCELVPVEELIKMRDFDRRVTYKYSREDTDATIEKLKKSILETGILSPVKIDYYQYDKIVLMTEGNHRLNAAIDLGLQYYPATVYRLKMEYPKSKNGKGLKVQGYQPDEFGYVPGNMKPSDVGISSLNLN